MCYVVAMTNNMKRDRDGRFIYDKENTNQPTLSAYKRSPMDFWEEYTIASCGYGHFDAVVADSEVVSLLDTGGYVPLMNGMKLQHEATMAAAREARAANMIAIATHKEYFNKGIVSAAYAEIDEYINGKSEDSVMDDFLDEVRNRLHRGMQDK